MKLTFTVTTRDPYLFFNINFFYLFVNALNNFLQKKYEKYPQYTPLSL